MSTATKAVTEAVKPVNDDGLVFTCERNYWSEAMSVALGVVSSRNTLPILANVLIQSQDDTVTVTATDLDTALTTTIPANVTQQGGVAVPAAMLNDIISKLPDAPITLRVDAKGASVVRCGKSEYKILSLSSEDYPVVPDYTSQKSITLPNAEWKRLFNTTMPVTSKEETRSILMGVLLEWSKGVLTCVATDTHRLAAVQAKAEMVKAVEMDDAMSIIIPARPLATLIKAMKGDFETTVYFSDKGVQFSGDGFSMVSRVLDGQFPNYEKVIPKSSAMGITFNRDELSSAVKRAFIVAKQNNEKVIFTVKAKDGVAEIAAESSDIGKAYEEVAIECTGEDLTFAVNARYVVETLHSMEAERVTFYMNGALNPLLLKEGVVEEHPSVSETPFFILMPMAA